MAVYRSHVQHLYRKLCQKRRTKQSIFCRLENDLFVFIIRILYTHNMVSTAVFRSRIILIKTFRFDFLVAYDEMFLMALPEKLLSIRFSEYFEIFL